MKPKPVFALDLWNPFAPGEWAPEGGLPVIEHVQTGQSYVLLGVVIREHDLVPCAVYRIWHPSCPVPVWCRPLVEVLEGEKWEWFAEDNETLSKLAQTLTLYSRTETA